MRLAAAATPISCLGGWVELMNGVVCECVRVVNLRCDRTRNCGCRPSRPAATQCHSVTGKSVHKHIGQRGHPTAVWSDALCGFQC